MIDFHQENVFFKGAAGTKHGLRERFLQVSVPLHEPNTHNPSPQGACTHPKRIIEGDVKNLDCKGKGGGEHEPIHLQSQRHSWDCMLAMLPQGLAS